MRTPIALLPVVLAGTLVLAPSPGNAESGVPTAIQPTSNLPDGFKVLEDYVEALGGEKAYRTHKTEESAGGGDGSEEALTTREDAILRLVAVGRSNKEIANELNLAEGTVKNYVSRIMDKLNVRSRTELAVKAVKTRPK